MKLGLILLLAIMPVSMVTQGNCNPLKDVIPFSSDDDSKINKVLQNTQNFNEPEKYNAYTFDDWYEREEWKSDDVDPKLFYQMFLNE